MRISDWSSDVCSSDLTGDHGLDRRRCAVAVVELTGKVDAADHRRERQRGQVDAAEVLDVVGDRYQLVDDAGGDRRIADIAERRVTDGELQDRKSTRLNSSH